jgi:hypothetical protein
MEVLSSDVVLVQQKVLRKNNKEWSGVSAMLS